MEGRCFGGGENDFSDPSDLSSPIPPDDEFCGCCGGVGLKKVQRHLQHAAPVLRLAGAAAAPRLATFTAAASTALEARRLARLRRDRRLHVGEAAARVVRLVGRRVPAARRGELAQLRRDAGGVEQHGKGRQHAEVLHGAEREDARRALLVVQVREHAVEEAEAEHRLLRPPRVRVDRVGREVAEDLERGLLRVDVVVVEQLEHRPQRAARPHRRADLRRARADRVVEEAGDILQGVDPILELVGEQAFDLLV